MSTKKRIHFISIGGRIMHNLAIDAQLKGGHVSGSDDEIYEPSRSRLTEYGLLPAEMGWNPERISEEVDEVVVGMHAQSDNPELLKAQALGLPILSFPEYVYQQCEDKQRVVIAGSHGKTTITSIIIHVLEQNGRLFDYLVGATPRGKEHMVRLSEEAPLVLLEGDEYPSAPQDNQPKFLHYQHHIGLISGIAWDHMNVYPTFEDYIAPFEQFADRTPKAGSLIFSQDDSLASVIGAKERQDVQQIPYQTHPHKVIDGNTYLLYLDEKVPIQIFGEHNLKNISGALHICKQIGVAAQDFYRAISSFEGAPGRLEKIGEHNGFHAFLDFAHAPSKLSATTLAIKKQFIERKLVACFELHTYSSLNKEFLPQYKDSFRAADRAIIYYNPENLKKKGMSPLEKEEIQEAFDHDQLTVITQKDALREHLLGISWHNKTLLMMSSGSFDQLNLKDLFQDIVSSQDTD